MSDEMCDECGDAGWVWAEVRFGCFSLVPCPTCLDEGREIPPKPELDPDDEEDDISDLVGWEEV